MTSSAPSPGSVTDFTKYFGQKNEKQPTVGGKSFYIQNIDWGIFIDYEPLLTATQM